MNVMGFEAVENIPEFIRPDLVDLSVLVLELNLSISTANEIIIAKPTSFALKDIHSRSVKTPSDPEESVISPPLPLVFFYVGWQRVPVHYLSLMKAVTLDCSAVTLEI